MVVLTLGDDFVCMGSVRTWHCL